MRLFAGAAMFAALFAPGMAVADEDDAPDPSAEDEAATPPPEEEPSSEERIRALEELVRQLQSRVDQLESPPDSPSAPLPEAAPAPVELDLSELDAALAEDAAPTTRPTPPPRPVFNPDISITADVALAWFSADEPLQTGAHDPSVNGFNLQQLEMAIGAPVDPYFRFDANLVFGQFGVEVEEAYATTQGLPLGLQFRVGQFLTRFGRTNATHPHSWDFVDQPFPLGRVMGGEGNRGLGAEASVLMPFPWYFEVLGSIGMANGAATARSFFAGNDLGVKTPADFESVVALKQFWALGPDVSLLWGVSWADGPNSTGRDNRSDIFGTDLFFKVRPVTRGGNVEFTWLAEVVYRRRQVPVDVWSDWGLLTQAQLRFAKRWATALRYEYGTPTVNEGGATVVDPLDPAWLSDRHRASVAVTFWPTEFSRVRLQGGLDAPLWSDELHGSVILAFEFNLGAHGAHAF